MAALLRIDAAGSLPAPRRRTAKYNVALTAPVSARRRGSFPSRGLRCAGAEVGAAEKPDAAVVAIKEAVDVPLPPFEQSLVAVGSASDSAAANKLGFKETFTYVMYGTGAFVAGWILSAFISAIESIPLLPRILEIVGLGYTIWFSSRYLLFKENRDELFAKAYDLKLKIIGSDDA
ncbi:uncharacterized protein LOC124672034 [Lolium rigidum]|uniref:uncharacterized protein LOC124672034 n=1 Tax=Lolium rigidum TaxID=89674 RepID=UPI001F5C5AC5|nr:uncharacterized protein LOC124672034 [Lolium rigidum]